MYGIGAVKYKDFTIGYIEKNSFDLGGKKPEAAKIEAEQVQGAPVLVIPQSNGGIAPTFNVIQMNYSNLHKLLGGSLHYKKEDLEKKTPIGWTAPSEVLVMQGPWELSLVSGQMIEDVRLAVNGKVKVEHFGRLGGIVPDPDEIVTALKEKIIK